MQVREAKAVDRQGMPFALFRKRGGRVRRRLVMVSMLCVSVVAHAQQPDSDSVAETPDSFKVVFEGRFEMRVTSTDDKQWARAYVPRVILGAKFEQGRFRGEAEFGIETLPEVRDAWLRAKLGKGVSVRAGHFRPPFGRFEMESRWSQPIVRRGATSAHDKRLGFAGRRSGFEGRLRLKAWPGSPQLEGGVFEGDLLPDGTRGEDLVLRGVVAIQEKLTVGAGVYSRATFREGASDRFLGAVDAGFVTDTWAFEGEVQAGPQLKSGHLRVSRFIALSADARIQPALSLEAVRPESQADFSPYIVPAVAVEVGIVRGVLAVELGAGRESAGSTRRVGVSAVIGAEF